MRVWRQARVVRLPVHLHELMAKVKKTEADLRQASSRKPSSAELADASGITQQKLAMLMNVRAGRPPLELPGSGLGFRNREPGVWIVGWWPVQPTMDWVRLRLEWVCLRVLTCDVWLSFVAQRVTSASLQALTGSRRETRPPHALKFRVRVG